MKLTRHRGILAAALVVAGSLAGAAGAGAGTDTESERASVRDRRAAIADQIDVLTATDAEIEAILDDVDTQIATQQRAVDAAAATAEAAAADLADAETALRGARRDVALLERAIVDMAVASYVHPPTADLVQSLQAASLSEAVLQQTYLAARAQRDVDLLDLLERAESIATARADEVADAAAAADAAVEAATAALGDLQTEQRRQAAFAADLHERIDASLAESAVLAELDAELSQEIAAEQAALLARLPPPPPPVPEPAVTPPPVVTIPPTTLPSTTVPASGTGAEPSADPPSTPTTVTTAPPSVTPPSTSTPPLRTVRGITVHADIADDVEALLAAAAADGVSLSGWGYRSTERQIELRRAHCGPTNYDIWIRPAGSCSPPTAVPGRSLHEQGRAIDFTVGGRVIGTRSSDGFRWLAANASSFGLFNLPSEPWHWSTSGG